jgi:hypothetical protein
MGSRIIESAAFYNQILLAQVYINRAQNTSVNLIIRLLVIVIALMSAQSDPIKRWALYQHFTRCTL